MSLALHCTCHDSPGCRDIPCRGLPEGAVPRTSVYYAAWTGPLLPVTVRETDTTQQYISDRSYTRHSFKLEGTWWHRKFGFVHRRGESVFYSPKESRPAVGLFPRDLGSWYSKISTRLHLVPALKMLGTMLSILLLLSIISQRIRSDNIIFIYEACFLLNGSINWHNNVYWVQDSRHATVDAHHQTNPRIITCCAIQNNTSLGPVFLEGGLIACNKWRVGTIYTDEISLALWRRFYLYRNGSFCWRVVKPEGWISSREKD